MLCVCAAPSATEPQAQLEPLSDVVRDIITTHVRHSQVPAQSAEMLGSGVLVLAGFLHTGSEIHP